MLAAKSILTTIFLDLQVHVWSEALASCSSDHWLEIGLRLVDVAEDRSWCGIFSGDLLLLSCCLLEIILEYVQRLLIDVDLVCLKFSLWYLHKLLSLPLIAFLQPFRISLLEQVRSFLFVNDAGYRGVSPCFGPEMGVLLENLVMSWRCIDYVVPEMNTYGLR